MKVFVINLERSPDRREYMSAQLNQQNLNFEFIKATDYKNIPESDYEKLCDVDAVSKNPFFTKGVLACALSHVEAYKRIIHDNLDMALILEDDVALGRDLKDLLPLVEKEIGKDEIVSLIYFSHYGNTSYLSNIDKKALNKHYSLLFPVKIEEVSCAMAYVITKEVAQRMLEIAVPVYGPADYWGGFFKRKVFSSFRCVSPVPVEPASFRSVINYAASKTIKSKIAAFVRKNKIPFLYSYLQKKDKSFIEQKSKIVYSNDLPFLYQGNDES